MDDMTTVPSRTSAALKVAREESGVCEGPDHLTCKTLTRRQRELTRSAAARGDAA